MFQISIGTTGRDSKGKEAKRKENVELEHYVLRLGSLVHASSFSNWL